MRFVIVTGMSGAGKSSVLKMLEDAGYFCVDNLPIPLIPKLTSFIISEGRTVKKAALGVDVRNGQALEALDDVIKELNAHAFNPEIIFLDSDTEVLVKRYKETRRSHPLAGEGRVDKGIELERERLEFLKKRADYIIDTSHMLIRDLKTEVDKIFVQDEKYNNFFISVVSFGFKYGILADADLVFDVRFLPNPFYIPELKKKTGLDQEVYDYVRGSDVCDPFLDKLEDMVKFLIPNYIIEGKNQIVIGIGCTGGKHRSVTIARAIMERLSNLNYGINIEHRDIMKGV